MKPLNKNKDTPLQLACQARYGEIDWENLKLEDLIERDSFGETLLHHLIRIKPLSTPWDADHDNPKTEHLRVKAQLDKIPRSLIVDKILRQKTKRDKSIYLMLAQAGALSLVPQELITKEILLKNPKDPESENEQDDLPDESILFEIIARKQLEIINPRFIEEGILLEECKQLNTTYLHICAMLGELKKVPKELWIDKLGLKDSKRNNLLHWAADGVFEGVPVNKETINLMNEKNINGATPLHQIRDITSIAKEFTSNDMLYSKDKNQRSALYSIAQRTPEKFVQFWVERKNLKEDTLLEKDSKGERILDSIFIKYYPKESHKYYKKFVGMLSQQTLVDVKNIERYKDIQKVQNLINGELNKRMIKNLAKEANTIEI